MYFFLHTRFLAMHVMVGVLIEMKSHLRCCDFLLVLGERSGWGGGGKTSSSKMAPPASLSDPEKERFRCDLRCCCCACAAAAAAEEEEELLWEPKEVLRSALPPPEASDEVEGPREPHEISSTRESLERSNHYILCWLTLMHHACQSFVLNVLNLFLALN